MGLDWGGLGSTPTRVLQPDPSAVARMPLSADNPRWPHGWTSSGDKVADWHPGRRRSFGSTSALVSVTTVTRLKKQAPFLSLISLPSSGRS